METPVKSQAIERVRAFEVLTCMADGMAASLTHGRHICAVTMIFYMNAAKKYLPGLNV